MTTILVTGGAGFIGSALVRLLIQETTAHVVNVDVLTYAGNPDSVADVALDPRYTFAQDDICDAEAIRALFEYHRPDAVIHLAAESHVDRSIDGPAAFVQTNVVGTFTMLQEALRHWRGLDAAARAAFRFIHVSTDEVYGSLEEGTPPFTERTPYAPNSPYSASKAGSDHLVRAWFHTYGLPTIITNCSNNYGPRQFPEKLIPLTILNAVAGQPLPVYGKGTNVRDWLYVDDHARALHRVLEAGTPGRTYVIGARSERRNIDIVHRICDILDELRPDAEGSHRRLVTFVTDRPGHDHRYAIDPSVMEQELGWAPRESLESGLEHTVRWYLDNVEWVSRVRSGAYRGERLGLGAGDLA